MVTYGGYQRHASGGEVLVVSYTRVIRLYATRAYRRPQMDRFETPTEDHLRLIRVAQPLDLGRPAPSETWLLAEGGGGNGAHI